jgi:serine phosphatase RsbU (regulator of sigma subunit)/Tfp pilus assembly protein PilF
VKYFFSVLISFCIIGANTIGFCASESALLKQLESEKNISQQAGIYNQLAEEVINADPDKSIEYAQKAIQLAKKSDNPEALADGLLHYGTGLYYIDEYARAIKEVKAALEIYRKENLKVKQGVALNMMGEIYVYWSKYDEALNYLSKARKILEESELKPQLARCYNNLGIIYKNQMNQDEALVFFKRAFSIGDDVRKGDASLYMGEVYLAQQRYADAETSLKTAISYAKKNDDNYVLADAQIGLARVNSFYGKTTEAMELFTSALGIKEEVEDQQGMAIASTGIGNLYLQMNKPQMAHNWFMKGARIAAKINTREELRAAYLGLSNTYHIKDMNDSAYIFLNLYNKISHEIMSAEASKKLRSLEKALEEDKRKQEEAYRKSVTLIVSIGAAIVLLFFVILAYVMAKRYKEKKKSNQEIMRQRDELSIQKIIIEEKNKEITDSINYARRIQLAMLSEEHVLKKYFSESFILFMPKDIVSGDFFWFAEKNKKFIYATADCTGHGVPGGFMSMLNVSLLNEVVLERGLTDPGEILNHVRNKIILAMKQTGAEGENKDGMDIVLTVFDPVSYKLNYAAANNGFYMIRNNQVLSFSPHKQPIGYFAYGMTPFTSQEISLEPGDRVYTFTDGFADQFGGPRGKKYKYKQLEEVLLQIHREPMKQQHDILREKLIEWQGDLEQNDDICLIGICVQ